MYIIGDIRYNFNMFIEISAYQCTCERCDYTWPSLKLPKTCAKCRSPYWDTPRGGNSPVVTTPIEKTPELEKKSAASPDIEEEPKKSLHPERTDAERLSEIAALKALTDEENYKKQSILPVWTPPKPVEDQPSYDELNALRYD